MRITSIGRSNKMRITILCTLHNAHKHRLMYTIVGGDIVAVDIEKRNKRQNQWIKENKERINMMFPKGFKEKITEVAGDRSISQYVIEAVNEKIAREKGGC